MAEKLKNCWKTDKLIVKRNTIFSAGYFFSEKKKKP